LKNNIYFFSREAPMAAGIGICTICGKITGKTPGK
jgi:hypothetical protein